MFSWHPDAEDWNDRARSSTMARTSALVAGASRPVKSAPVCRAPQWLWPDGVCRSCRPGAAAPGQSFKIKRPAVSARMGGVLDFRPAGWHVSVGAARAAN